MHDGPARPYATEFLRGMREGDVVTIPPPSLDGRCCQAADRAFVEGDHPLSRHLSSVSQALLHESASTVGGLRDLAAVSAFLAGDDGRGMTEGTREALADAGAALLALAAMSDGERGAHLASARRARYGGHIEWRTPPRKAGTARDRFDPCAGSGHRTDDAGSEGVESMTQDTTVATGATRKALPAWVAGKSAIAGATMSFAMTLTGADLFARTYSPLALGFAAVGAGCLALVHAGDARREYATPTAGGLSGTVLAILAGTLLAYGWSGGGRRPLDGPLGWTAFALIASASLFYSWRTAVAMER